MIDPASSPNVAGLRAAFQERFPFTRDIVDRGAATFGPAWVEDCEAMLGTVFSSTEELGLAARGYAMFALDLLRRQKRFEAEREYPAKTYAEAAAEVYFDDEYMRSQYLPGLLLSHYLWPHHYRQLAFFESAFVAPMRFQDAGRFAEVGIGTGLYSRLLLQAVPTADGLGLDISPASRAFAERHVRAFGLGDRYETALRDVVADPIEPHDWLVCVEVLEHLEEPVAFLEALRSSLAPGGRAFITTALNAANVDHIFLYETPDQVAAHLTTAGFALEQSFHAAAHPPRQAGVPVPSVAAFVVV